MKYGFVDIYLLKSVDRYLPGGIYLVGE